MTLAKTTRRRFIELLPLSALATVAACSKAPEPAPTGEAAPLSNAPVAPPPAPTAAPAPVPATVAPVPATVAADAPMVDEKDALPASLGYVAVAERADKARLPAFVAGSHCGNCALYQGAAGSATGGCPIFAGRRVAATGWCSSWVKKA